jgi:hypothetical protein
VFPYHFAGFDPADHRAWSSRLSHILQAFLTAAQRELFPSSTTSAPVPAFLQSRRLPRANKKTRPRHSPDMVSRSAGSCDDDEKTPSET